MKTILLSALLGLATQAMAQGQISLDFNLKNADGQKIHVFYGDNAQDSAIVSNGRASFKGQISKPYTGVFVAFGNYDPRDPNGKYLRGYADAGTTTTITADLNNLDAATYEGGKTQSDYNELQASIAVAHEKLQTLNKGYYEADRETQEKLRAQMEPYSELYKAGILCFVKTHPDSYVAPEQMRSLIGEMTYDEIKAIYDPWTPEVKATDAAKEVEDELNTLARVAPGSPAPDFTADDINGKPFTLSSLKGKVVIIDFWASWCVPCRKSNPHMLELYKKYHDLGLEMVYVSDDDSAPDKWRAAVEKDQLTGDGFHHVLRGMKWDRSKGMEGIDHSNDISDKYAIHFLPTKYLIDRDGNVVCKISEEEEKMLDLYLAAMLK